MFQSIKSYLITMAKRKREQRGHGQKGFTLIELLLVLAIIGIISAIAIPALVGQRSRAKDKSANANLTTVISEMPAIWDRQQEAGWTLYGATAKATDAASATAGLLGTVTSSPVPEVWTQKNPWDATVSGYIQSFLLEAQPSASVPAGSVAIAAATSTTAGQVQLGFCPPTGGAPGYVSAAVWDNVSQSVVSQVVYLD